MVPSDGGQSHLTTVRASGREELLAEILSSDLGLVVLRNWRGLPEAPPGTDIDVTISSGDLESATEKIEAIAADLGWHSVLINRRGHMAAIPLVSSKGGEGGAVHLDVFNGISCLGLTLIASRELADWSVTTGGVRHLPAEVEALTTLTHHLAWNGGIKRQPYLSEISAVLEGPDGEWLSDQIEARCGTSARAALEDLQSLRSGAFRRRSLVSGHVIAKGFRRDASSTFRSLMGYLWDHLKTLHRPSGLVCVEGAEFPGTDIMVTLEMACRLEPHSFAVPTVRSPAPSLQSTNAQRYTEQLRRRWRAAVLIRWLTPSIYLWWQAKRGEIVIVDRPPILLALIGQWKPFRWVAFGTSTFS